MPPTPCMSSCLSSPRWPKSAARTQSLALLRAARRCSPSSRAACRSASSSAARPALASALQSFIDASIVSALALSEQ
eukprot:scaffold95643_cov58-Phaeocystis_antarctica.AAC.3